MALNISHVLVAVQSSCQLKESFREAIEKFLPSLVIEGNRGIGRDKLI